MNFVEILKKKHFNTLEEVIFSIYLHLSSLVLETLIDRSLSPTPFERNKWFEITSQGNNRNFTKGSYVCALKLMVNLCRAELYSKLILRE